MKGVPWGRPKADEAAGKSAMVRGRGGYSFKAKLRSVTKEPDMLNHALGVAAARTNGGGYLGRWISNAADWSETVGDYESVVSTLDDVGVADPRLGAWCEFGRDDARGLANRQVEERGGLEPIKAAVPALAPGLPGFAANVIEAHQVVSKSGMKLLVLPSRRSTRRPLAASAASRLFQAVGPIFSPSH